MRRRKEMTLKRKEVPPRRLPQQCPISFSRAWGGLPSPFTTGAASPPGGPHSFVTSRLFSTSYPPVRSSVNGFGSTREMPSHMPPFGSWFLYWGGSREAFKGPLSQSPPRNNSETHLPTHWQNVRLTQEGPSL
jgi:hypothetical protein